MCVVVYTIFNIITKSCQPHLMDWSLLLPLPGFRAHQWKQLLRLDLASVSGTLKGSMHWGIHAKHQKRRMFFLMFDFGEFSPAASPLIALALSHPMTPYGFMVSHKLMGIYMGILILGVIL